LLFEPRPYVPVSDDFSTFGADLVAGVVVFDERRFRVFVAEHAVQAHVLPAMTKQEMSAAGEKSLSGM
jgi:hypothetical protein